MRPIRIEFQAFGPFSQRSVVDLQHLDEQALFGIYGPTGGGKTTVLDAISFVLFGESSGGERTPADLRSHYAGPDVLTYAELLFELNGRIYLARREPTQTVKARRGSGLTTHQHAAWLFDATGILVQDIHYPDNPGQVIAEKKAGEVNSKLIELLGYTKDQFRQIIVLPQGAFREFLSASGKQRSEILKSLFNTALFEQFTMRLKAERGALRKQLASAETAMHTVLQGITVTETPVADADALAAAVNSWGEKCSAAEQAVKAAETAQIQAAAALSQGQARAALFAEHRDALTAMASLDAEQPRMAQLRKTADAARRAANLSEAASGLETARKEAALASQRLQDHDKALQDAESAAKCFDDALQKSRALEPQRQQLAQELADQTRFAELLAAQQQPEQQLHSAKTALAAAKLEVQQAALEDERTRAEALTLKTRAEALATAKAQLAELRLTEKEIAEQLQAARAREDNSKALAQNRTKLQQAEQEFATLDQTYLAACRALSAALEQQRSAAAARLAAGLEDGTPCPVCGSHEHPAPAHRSEQSEPPETADLQLLQQAVTEASHNRQQVELQIRELNVILDQLRSQRQSWPSSGSESPSMQALQTAVRENKAALAAAEAVFAGAGALTDELNRNTAERPAAEAALTLARKNAETLARQVLELETRIDATLAAVPKALRNQAALSKAIATTQSQLEQSQQAHRQCEEAARTSREAEQLAHSRRQDTQAELAKREQDIAAKRDAFEEQLRAQGFADPRDYEAARQTPAEYDALLQELETYSQARAAAEHRMARAAVAIAEITPPDLEALAQASQQAEDARAGAIKALSILRTERHALQQAAQLYHSHQRKYQTVEQTFRTVATLAEIADGQGLNSRRISLVNWVLGAYFEDIMAAANRRFDRMSKGRFELRRSTEMGDKRGVSGLDIVVFDAWTGQERPARTLSGGESFLAALALALGLSDVVQAESGGVQLDAIFIDEGFGQLDEEALETALNSLNDLAESSRLIGLISHVDEVKQMVPAGFEVTRAPRGSQITPRK